MAYVYPNIQHTASTLALFDLVGWLLDDATNILTQSQFWTSGKGGTGGPGWTVIEAYGRDGDGNVKRGVPATVTGDGALASFETGSWIDNAGGTGSGSLGIRFPWSGATAGGSEWMVGDWIVLRSNGTNPFQLYIEYASTTSFDFKLIPLASKGNDDDFTLGATGTVTTPPPASDFPATSVPLGATTNFRSLATFAATAQYSGNADDRMMSWLPDDGNNPSFIYVGDLEGSAPQDLYPYVIRNQTAGCLFTKNQQSSGTFSWDRLSPVDELTLLINGVNELPFNATANGASYGMIYDGEDPGANVSEQGLGPVGVWFNDTGHLHFGGWLKNVFISSDTYGASGSINDPTAIPDSLDPVGPKSPGTRNYVYRWDGTFDSGGVALSWDGFTVYP